MDGQAADGGLATSDWPQFVGVTTALSPDGLTLTAVFDQGGAPLYTLTLDPQTGEYGFTLHNAPPRMP